MDDNRAATREHEHDLHPEGHGENETSHSRTGDASNADNTAYTTAASGYLGNLLQPLRKSKAFRSLWLGQLLSALGSSVSMVILPIVVYAMTGSTVAMGTVMAVYMAPYVLALPFAGLVVDRMNRVNVMLAADAVRFLLMLALMGLLLTERLTMPVLYPLMAVYGLMEGVFQPAYSAMRARIFTPDIRNAANALTQLTHQGVRLLGPTLGGTLAYSVSGGLGFGLDAVTYLLSLICLWQLKEIGTNQLTPSGAADKPNFKKDFLEGLHILRQNPWLWITIAAFALVNIFYSGVISVLVPWLFQVHYQLPSYMYGLAVTCSGVGGVTAAFLFGSKRNWHRRGLLAYGGVFLSALAMLMLSFVSWAPGLLALMFVEGFGIMIFALIWETSLQELVPEEAFGRVASIDLLGSFALMPLGYLLVGGVADSIGGVAAVGIMAGLVLVIVIAALCSPAIRKFD
ncbi:MFS transporter [Paenibacillus gansuensis]|uniref:MFS transporter n=1 Tax=Paenibacillus gansuensis TaxID=306542 RepID=A0ABW5PJZ4_9BACL